MDGIVLFPAACAFLLPSLIDCRAPMYPRRRNSIVLRWNVRISGPAAVPVDGGQGEGEESESRSPFMKTAALFDRWTGVVRSVEGGLTSAADKMAVRNPNDALQAALWIR